MHWCLKFLFSWTVVFPLVQSQHSDRWATVCRNSSQNQQLFSVINALSNTEEEQILSSEVAASMCQQCKTHFAFMVNSCFSLVSFLQERSSGEKSLCVKTRRTHDHCWSPLTSETGSRLTACNNVSRHTVQHAANIAHFVLTVDALIHVGVQD